MDEYKSRLSTYLSDMVREELEKYDGGFTDEWNDQRKKNAEVLGYKLSGKSDIKEGATEFWMDMFRPGPIPKKYINQLIKKRGELPSKKHIKKIYRDNGNPSSSQLAKTWKQLQKEKYVRAASGMWRWNADFTGWESISEEITDWQGGYNDEFKFKKGQLIKDINPDCPHHGSEGEVTKVTKDEVTYTVRNNGKTYKVGDELTKTKEQLTPLSIKESGILYRAGVKKYGKDGMKKIQQAAGKKKSHAEIGAIKDKYEKESLELDEGGMGILTTDQADVLQGIVMKNKNKSTKSILSVALKSGFFKGVDKKELLGYIDGARQFVKYMKSHPMESINEKMGPEQYHKYMQYVFDTQFKTPEEKKMKKSIIKKINKAQKKKGLPVFKEERDYKAEYKKYGSSTKAKKYRAELNQYNRKKGTYGNNDGKDASHKGGKIVGFEKESTNRGRREKSRLKKEDIREFSGDQGIHVYLGGILMGMKKARLKPKTAKQMKHGFSKSRDKIGFFIEVEKREIEGKKLWTLQLEIDKDGYLWYLSAPRDIKIGKWADTSQLVRGFTKLNRLPGFGQDAIFKRRK